MVEISDSKEELTTSTPISSSNDVGESDRDCLLPLSKLNIKIIMSNSIKNQSVSNASKLCDGILAAVNKYHREITSQKIKKGLAKRRANHYIKHPIRK